MSKASTATKNAKAVAKEKAKMEAAVTTAPKEKKVKAFTPSVKVLRTVDIPVDRLEIDEQFTGRSAPVAEDKVEELADTLRVRQVQPIQVREIPGTDRYKVIFGVTRTRAAQKIKEGYVKEAGKDGKADVMWPAIADFTLRAEVVEVSDSDAIFNNLVENAARNATTAIDDAKNHQMLRELRTEEYPEGMTDAAIKRLYGYGHQATVTTLKKLLTLPEEIQSDIHTGRMTRQAGFFLADWCKRRQFGEETDNGFRCDPEVIKNCLTPGDKDIEADTDNGLSTNYVVQAIKAYEKAKREEGKPTPEAGTEGGTSDETGEETGGETGTESGTETGEARYALTLKDFKTTLEEFAGLEAVSAKTAEFCTITLSFLKNEIEKDAFYDWISTNIS